MYFGRYKHKVDSKGRVQIPVTLRRADDDKIYDKFTLVRGVGGCISVFTRDEFERFVDAIIPEDMGMSDVIDFQRLFYSRTHEVELDNQGRILLPRLLREEAGIDSSALFLGAGKWFEIWNRDRFEEYSSQSEHSYDEIARHFFATLGRKKKARVENVSAE